MVVRKARLAEAEQQINGMLKNLETYWSALEGGIQDLENMFPEQDTQGESKERIALMSVRQKFGSNR